MLTCLDPMNLQVNMQTPLKTSFSVDYIFKDIKIPLPPFQNMWHAYDFFFFEIIKFIIVCPSII